MKQEMLQTVRADALESALVPLRFGGWVCQSILLNDENTLTVTFHSSGGADRLIITVGPKNMPAPIFRRLENCSVRYQGSLIVRTKERVEEAASLVMAVGLSIDKLLSRGNGVSLSELLGRHRGEKRIVFSRDSLRALLSPEIVEGAPFVEGFILMDVYPTSYLQQTQSSELELVVDFRREADQRRLLFVVKKRSDTRPAFARTTHFSVEQLSFNVADPPGADAVRALFAFILQLRDHPGLELVFPDVSADISTALLPAAQTDDEVTTQDESLNLAIDAECGQRCSFCSIKETAPAQDGGEQALARLFADLESNRQRGVRKVRINGYDPLGYSRILDVLRRVSQLGYLEAEVFSPCTRLADHSFCDEVLNELPKKVRFFVPVYSTNPQLHDTIVGRNGAFELVTKAIDNLLARLGPGAISLLGVVTKQNVLELPAISKFAQQRGVSFSVHMPYPSFESKADRYYEAAPKMTDVANVKASALNQGISIDLVGVSPCVIFRQMREHGIAPKQWVNAEEHIAMLPGTEYRDDKFKHRASQTEHAAFTAATVPCPHKQKCVLSQICPGEILRAYAELYGLDEIRAVSLFELVAAC